MFRNRNLATLVFTIAFGACAAAPAAQKDKGSLEVWLTQECPSLVEPDAKAPKPEAAIIDNLIGAGIGFLVDQLGTALTAAAKADKEGLAISGAAPSYLYYLTAVTGSKTRAAQIQRCAVLAISESPPNKWCAIAPFAGSRACETINDGGGMKPRLEAFLKTPAGYIQSLNGSGAPAFYSEIEFIDSSDKKALIPRVRALFYPAGVNDSNKFTDSKKQRSVALTVSGSTPAGQPALGSVHIVLKNILPQPRFQIRAGKPSDYVPTPGLDASPSALWVSYTSPPAETGIGATETAAVPVNLTAEVREIGDTNVFLQTLAAAFAANKTSIETSLKSKLEPSAVAQAATTKEASALDAFSKFQALMAVVYKDDGMLVAACAKPQSTGKGQDVGRAEVFQAIYQLQADQSAAQKFFVQNPDVGAPHFAYAASTVSDQPSVSAFATCSNLHAR